jgi:hypothetical protein
LKNYKKIDISFCLTMKFVAGLFLAGLASTGAFAPVPAFSRTSALNIAVGDAVPSIDLHENFPPDFVNIADYSKGKKIIIVGLPGAFTPT